MLFESYTSDGHDIVFGTCNYYDAIQSIVNC